MKYLMIAYLKGKVHKIFEKSFILDCRDVGYELFSHNGVLSVLEMGKDLEFFVHTHVREDQFTLYAFASLSERDFFRMLISVSGIGPKTGLEMLGQPLDRLKNAILTDDVAVLSSTPGIGKKTAQRLIVELKSKVGDVGDFDISVVSGGGNCVNEAVDALLGLGYRRHQVMEVLKGAPEKIGKAEELVTFFLQNV